jgi:C_GCAxxG_C_C family probable redox protein
MSIIAIKMKGDPAMPRKKLEKKAFDYFDNGFCCSEALSKTIIDHYADKPDDYPVKVASAFCGGIGRSRADVCGALAGAVIAVGYLYGRTEQGKDLSNACTIISEFRSQFLETFGSTNCERLLEKLGEQEKSSKCKQLTAKATGMLSDILVQTKAKQIS